MAQLRQAMDQFLKRDTAIVIVGPDNEAAFARYFEKHGLEYTGCPDPRHSILKLYGQQVKLFKLGRMPAQVLVDKQGIVRFAHYGLSMRDIPTIDEMLELIEEINEKS
jgi:peroxiredoxin Q/BCP